MTGCLRIVLGDQLSRRIAALCDADPQADTVLMMEVMEEASYVPHHPKKIAFLFSAMRHFAQALRDEGFQVRYVSLDDADNSGSFSGEVARAVADLTPDRIVVTHPGEHRVLTAVQGWADEIGRAHV